MYCREEFSVNIVCPEPDLAFLTTEINLRGGSRNDFSSRCSSSPSPPSDSPGRLKIFYNIASRSPILMIFTFLKMALKFIGSSSLLEECGSNISRISSIFLAFLAFLAFPAFF